MPVFEPPPSMPSDNLLSIVILNWNGQEHTLECLQSLWEQRDAMPLRLIVVDNGSREDPCALFTEWAVAAGAKTSQVKVSHMRPEIDLSGLKVSECDLLVVRSDTNLGFCEGNNLGAKASFELGASHVLALNNDTVAGPGFIKGLCSALREDDGQTLYSPQIAFACEPDTIWWYGGSFSSALQARYQRQGEPIRVADPEPPKTEWVSGCATLISRTVYEDIGLFDPKFFIYAEEWDLSLRARAAGKALKIVPDGLLYHKVGRTLGIISPLVFYYLFRNALILRGRHLPRWRLALNLLGMIPHKLVQGLRLAFQSRDSRYVLAYFDALRDWPRGGAWSRQERYHWQGSDEPFTTESRRT